MFFRRKAPDSAPISGALRLYDAVRASLPGADEDDVRMVTALAGLLASVAYADRSLSSEEESHAREALAGVHGLSAQSAEAIVAVMKAHLQDIATINPQAFTRELRDGVEVEVRREVLDVLVDLAAADAEIAHDEVSLLRRTATALGLSQDDYVIAQTRHRDKLKRA